MSRVLDVVRIQLVHWPALLGYPLLALAAMPLLGWGTEVFPFTLGLGVTRRAFAAATALVVLGQALLLGLGLVAFDIVERLTGGWGREARIFGLDVLGHGNPLALWLVYSGPLVAVSAIGVLAGVVFQRWRHTGIYLAIFGSVALLAAVGVLGKTQNWWPSIGSFLGGQPSLTLFTAYPLMFALALGGAGWLVLRRATA
ncbi:MULTISPECIES: hypothetical protein [Protofrankia]|uniref:Uncharacterized protein n=1 Tax=Protofrankia coriariae TaxID=1562887 RepID=A0ABR5F1Q9_9ACTN|nr:MULTISPECIES: hypothetical protein [Protofrankia]KLL10610.1 hypothetical protein FrCorBMG51_16490 [Protofrankia coriariae]ONH35130.1 hypothetical protein BL254_13155 [Protofrankia sp. BMG5.30]